MKIITLFGSLLMAILRITLTLVMAAGFLLLFVPSVVVRRSLQLY